MLIRPFRNTDPQALVELWRTLPALRARAQNFSTDLLERLILDKAYFTRDALLVAERDGKACGFVLTGNGPSADGGGVDVRRGAIFVLAVAPAADEADVARQLIAAAEERLRATGAEEIVAGGATPGHAYCLGLYGGSEVPGLLESDATALSYFLAAGYIERERRQIWQIDLPKFRPPFNPKVAPLASTHELVPVGDPPAKHWFEACTLGQMERYRFHVQTKAKQEYCGQVTFWDIWPLGETWGVRCAGLVEMEILGERRRKGLATFLFTRSLKLLADEGFVRAEIHTGPTHAGLAAMLAKLKAERVEEGIVLVKQLVG